MYLVDDILKQIAHHNNNEGKLTEESDMEENGVEEIRVRENEICEVHSSKGGCNTTVVKVK